MYISNTMDTSQCVTYTTIMRARIRLYNTIILWSGYQNITTRFENCKFCNFQGNTLTTL